ncbi:hypothetical protein [Nonomuraea bangladeshensis]|uniref:hypothetical protein n=1 Tax=Nonomuraea bangladeshensis TaxID=404385 RepID=UPI003C3095C9
MTTWTQDYPALPGSAHAAAAYADAIVGEHLPGRGGDAGKIVRGLFQAALARSSPLSRLNLTTIFDDSPRRFLRFELVFPNDVDAPDAPLAHQIVSALADSCGETWTRRRRDRMIYAELWEHA